MDAPLPTVISVDELRPRLGAVVLLDARGGPEGREGYLQGHLPGALHADLDRDLAGPAATPERGGRHPLPSPAAFSETLSRWGIGADADVVVYDAQGGGNAAARAWWMLRAIGQRAVAVLDGGLPAARAGGLPLETSVPVTAPVARPRPSAWGLPTVALEEVDALRGDPRHVLVDVRSAERFEGVVEPIDPVAGHIPGARNLFWGASLDASGRLLAPEALRAHLAPVFAAVPPERRVVHCGSGVTACQTLLALEHAGLGGASLYVGSWSEWCRSDRDRAP